MLLHASLEYYSRTQPELIFAEHGERQTSYADAFTESLLLASALHHNGLEPGDRVAYLAKNRTDLLLMMFAASRRGVVLVPLNYRLAPTEWAYIIHDSGSRAVFAAKEFCEGIDTIRAQLSDTEQFVCLDDDSSEQWTTYASWLSKGIDSPSPPNHEVKNTDICYQMYTSGTTGHPKGALMSQQNIHSNINQWVYSLPVLYPAGSRTLVVLPLYHTSGTFQSLVAIQRGNTLIIHHDVEPQVILNTLSEDNICWTGMVPAILQMCLQVAAASNTPKDYSSLKAIIYGAAPIAASVLEQAIDVFDCDFSQIFGQTEACAALTILSSDDHRRAKNQPSLLRSAGRSIMGTDLKIVDTASNHELAAGEVGELIARGPQIMQGYWNLPSATANTLQDGWLYTGDAAYIDEQGYVFIQDRIKDMIISGGENIYPAEVENTLYSHPEIREVAVIGVPDGQYGEALLAVIATNSGENLETEELIEFCRSTLAGYKSPRQFQFIEALPRTVTGKVLKRTLRAPYWKGHERKIS